MSNKYLLYLDILGFSNLVKNLKPHEIREVLNTTIKTLDETKEHYKQPKIKYKSLCFSDTLLLWSEESNDAVFHQLSYLSRHIFADLLSKRIPVRGAIVYGDFNVEKDKTNNHELFWGKALIDAYRIEKKEKWIGIVVCSSALKEIVQNGTVEKGEHDGLWIQRKTDKYLKINPFFYIKNYLQDMAEGLLKKDPSELFVKKAIRKELMAFRFITSQALNYKKNNKLSKSNQEIAKKYFNTQAFLKKVLGEECYRCALGESVFKRFVYQKHNYIVVPRYLDKDLYD